MKELKQIVEILNLTEQKPVPKRQFISTQRQRLGIGIAKVNLPFQGEDRRLVVPFPGRCRRIEISRAFSPKKLELKIELKIETNSKNIEDNRTKTRSDGAFYITPT